MDGETSVFIRSIHRPDLRTSLGRDLNSGKQVAALSSDVVAYLPRFSACNEKDDKKTGSKEVVGKEDKNPKAAAPGPGGPGPGPVDQHYRAREGSYISESLTETVYSTFFA
jgi:hypothetical protein